MAKHKLSHLVGDYHSDSDNDDSDLNGKSSTKISTDWTQCTDASSGHPYYWNTVTKDVRWDMPLEYSQFLEQAAKQDSQFHKKWILCHTDDNAPYYFNEITREISWEKPDDFVDTTKTNYTNNATNTGKQESGPYSTVDPICSNTKAKLNLVPEYNSDDSDEECSKSLETPLFPSSNTTNSQTIKSIVVSSNPKTTDQTQTDGAASVSTKKHDQKTENTHKEKPSFASIITGGRSPQHETVDITLYTTAATSQESDEAENRNTETPNDTELLPQKSFQRKRRIEFNVNSSHAKRAHQSDEVNANDEVAKETDNSIANLRSKYVNFQKGDTEFLDQQPSSGGSSDAIAVKTTTTNEEINDEQQLLEAKLLFLCQGKTDVSPVQVIQIQLQALQAAHIAEALHSDYIREWMRNISNDLCNLEKDAAPAGWKCLWNREKALYCYENETTGEIKWEYPDVETTEEPTNDGNDATVVADMDTDDMDISPVTSPSPIEHNDLPTTFNQNNESALPTAPMRTTTETSKNDNEKPLDDELASFYSVIGKLEPETTNEDNSCDKASPDPDRSVSPENTVSETDDKKKKKKKKTKKMEPWRSGNLEGWIYKWQQAQKELDG